MADAAEKKAESSAPDAEEKSDIQLEPTQEEMERERLTSKAEQVKKKKEGNNLLVLNARHLCHSAYCMVQIHVHAVGSLIPGLPDLSMCNIKS